MPADIDLRAEVLEGIDREIADCEMLQHAPGGRTLTALRHLREIVERHNTTDHETCTECSFDPPCPTLVSLAETYVNGR